MDKNFDDFTPEIIQAPFNIIDNRLEESGWLQKLDDDSVEIHARSIFLQGLLLMEQDKRPSYFRKWDLLWQNWHHWLKKENLSALDASLGYVIKDQRINNVVVGVDTAKHLGEILSASKKDKTIIYKKFGSKDINLINPSRWEL